MSSKWTRISLFVACIGAAPALLAAAPPPGAAPSTPLPPGAARAVQAALPPVRVVGVNVHADNSSGFLNAYEKGPITLNVQIENTSDVAQSGLGARWARMVATGTQSADVPVNDIAPHAKVVIQLHDPDGAIDGCQRKPYSVQLSGPGADRRVREIFVNPSCMFTTKLTDSLSSMTPDRAHEQRTGHASLANAKLGGNMACGQAFALTTDVVNKAPSAGKDLLLHFAEGDGTALADSKPIEVASGATVASTVTSYQHHGRIGQLKVTLTDPKSSLGGKLASQELDIDVRRQCMLAAGLGN